jgi:hypothetical protein
VCGREMFWNRENLLYECSNSMHKYFNIFDAPAENDRKIGEIMNDKLKINKGKKNIVKIISKFMIKYGKCRGMYKGIIAL